METRARIHVLVDELTEQELMSVERFLLDLRNDGDSLHRVLLQAPEDDEPETAEEKAAVQEAYGDIATGRLIAHEAARRQRAGRCPTPSRP